MRRVSVAKNKISWCKPIETRNGRLRCIICGNEYKKPLRMPFMVICDGRPPFYKLLVRFLIALLKHAINCFKRVSWKRKLDRYKTCVKCKYFIRMPRRKRICKICWCDLKIKTSWKQEKCPAKFWPEQQVEKKLPRNN